MKSPTQEEVVEDLKIASLCGAFYFWLRLREFANNMPEPVSKFGDGILNEMAKLAYPPGGRQPETPQEWDVLNYLGIGGSNGSTNGSRTQ